jgi:hypothetical protein
MSGATCWSLAISTTGRDFQMPGLSDAEQKVATCERSRAGLDEALALVDERLGAAGIRLSELRDEAERREVARQATAEVEALASVLEEFREVSARLTAAVEPLAVRISSSADFLPRTKLLLADIATAAASLAHEGRSFAVQVESGHRLITRPAPPVPQAEPTPEVERTEIYALAPLKWTELGHVNTVVRYGVARPPTDVAAYAIAHNLADVRASSRVQKLIEAFGVSYAVASADQCVSLDTQPEPPPRTAPGELVEVVGTPRTMEVRVDRI